MRQPERENLPGSEKPFLRFIYLNHDDQPADWRYLLSLFRDVNAVIMEYLTEDQKTREMLSQDWNLLLANPEDLDPADRKRQDKYLKDFNPRAMITQLLTFLSLSGKRLFLVDINQDHPAYALGAISSEDIVRLLLHLGAGNLALAQAVFQQISQNQAESNRQREEIVHQQIEAIAADWNNNEKIPLRAAVIQGASHWPTADLFPTDLYQIEKETLTELPYTPQLWNNLRLGQAISETELNRALLCTYVFGASVDLFDSQPYLSHQARFDAITAALSDAEVRLLLQRYAQMNAEGRNYVAVAKSILRQAKDWSLNR